MRGNDNVRMFASNVYQQTLTNAFRHDELPTWKECALLVVESDEYYN